MNKLNIIYIGTSTDNQKFTLLYNYEFEMYECSGGKHKSYAICIIYPNKNLERIYYIDDITFKCVLKTLKTKKKQLQFVGTLDLKNKFGDIHFIPNHYKAKIDEWYDEEAEEEEDDFEDDVYFNPHVGQGALCNFYDDDYYIPDKLVNNQRPKPKKLFIIIPKKKMFNVPAFFEDGQAFNLNKKNIRWYK